MAAGVAGGLAGPSALGLFAGKKAPPPPPPKGDPIAGSRSAPGSRAVDGIKQILQTPVIGVKWVRRMISDRGHVEHERTISLELRAWELGLLAFAGVVAYGVEQLAQAYSGGKVVTLAEWIAAPVIMVTFTAVQYASGAIMWVEGANLPTQITQELEAKQKLAHPAAAGTQPGAQKSIQVTMPPWYPLLMPTVPPDVALAMLGQLGGPVANWLSGAQQ